MTAGATRAQLRADMRMQRDSYCRRQSVAAISDARMVAARLAERLAAEPMTGIYLSAGSELSLDLLLHQPGLALCAPVLGPGGTMTFHRLRSGEPLTRNRFGIREPAPIDPVEPSCLIVPLLACDAHGNRLGQGAGYYDRWLADRTPRPCTIGVGYDFQLVDALTPEAHDIPLDAILTPSGYRASRPAVH